MRRFTLLLALTIAASSMTSVARADLIFGQEIEIIGSGGLWGGLHPFDTVTEFVLGFGTVRVTSQELPPPLGKKFAGEIRIDFLPTAGISPLVAALLANTPNTIDIFLIKDPLEANQINFVDSFEATTGAARGLALSDGSSIFWAESFPGELVSDPLNPDEGFTDPATLNVVIQWTQIPGPSSVALLTLAGLTGFRRRRR